MVMESVNKIKIILIEGSPNFAPILISANALNKYQFTSFSDGQIALEFLLSSQNSARLVILNYQLPSLNGIEIIRRTKEAGLKFNFLFISNEDSAAKAVEAIQAGAIDYLVMNSKLESELPNIVEKKINTSFTDITEHEQEEEEEDTLKINLSLLRIAGKTAKFGGWNHEIGTNRVLWSDEVAAIHEMPFGYSPMLEDGINFYAPEWRDRIKNAFNDCTKKGVPYDEILQIITFTGKRIWVRTTGEAIRNKSGKIVTVQGSFQDINEFKLTEEALREKEFFFKESQRAAFIGSYKTDFISGYWESSGVLDQIFGIDKNYNRSVQGWMDIVHPDDKEMMDRYLIEEVISKRKPFNKEYRIVRQNDGESRWVIGLGEVEFNAEGKIISLIGTIQDITERKLAEEKLRENEQLYHAIFEKTQAIKLIIDPTDGAIIDANPAAVQFYGYSLEQLLTINISHINTLSPEQIKFEMDNALTEQRSYFNFRHRLKSGDIRDVEVYSSPIKMGGHALLHSIIHDITERKLAEEKLRLTYEYNRSLIEVSLDPLVTIGSDGQITDVNNATERITGYNRTELIGTDFSDYFTEPEKARAGYQQVFREGLVHDYPLEIQHRNGRIFSVLYNAVVYMDASGKVIGVFAAARDITERKRVEKALQESEFFFKETQRAGYIGSYKTDFISGYWESSDVLDQIFGIDKSYNRSIQGWIDIVHPDDREMMDRYLKEEVILNRKPFNKEYRIIRKSDGKTRRVIGLGEVLFDADGNVLSLIGTIQDITERKLAEEALRESEERFRHLFEDVTIGLYRTTPDGNILLANPKAIQMLGYNSFDELSQHNLEKEGFEPSYSRTQFRKQLELNGEIHGLESAWTRRDGSIIFVNESAKVVRGSDGTILYYDGTIEDITNRKRAEEVLQKSQEENRAIIDANPDIIFRIKRNGIILSYHAPNSSALYAPPEVFLGKSIREVLPHQISEQAMNAIERAFQSKKVITFEYDLPSKGEQRYFESRIISLSNDESLSFIRDITERKHAEEKLIQLNHQLKEINATKDKLFSIIAHDLKSPFNSILGFSELLSQNLHSYGIEKTEKFVEQINSTAKSTLTLLENLLNWAKTQTGQIDFQPENLRLESIIQEIVVVLNSSAKIKNITLNYFQTDDFVTYADRNMLQTILRNLISNAIKFTNSGGKVDIYAISDKNQIEITISDNGVGISEETRSKLFKINGSISTKGTANEKGSGLGLILCKEFVEKQGGKIWVESELGKGSEFKFTLPKK